TGSRRPRTARARASRARATSGRRPPTPPRSGPLPSSLPRPALLRQRLPRLVGEAGRRPGAEPVVARAVERDHAARVVVAGGRGEKGDEPGVLLWASEPPERHRARRALL